MKLKMNVLALIPALMLLMSHIAFAKDDIEEQQDWSKAFEDGRTMTTMKSTELSELSGLVHSHRNPGLFWAHNDSGNASEIYLIDPTSGEIRLGVQLVDIENRDFEDITVRVIGDKSYVVIGDFGDNRAVREEVYLYQFEEPAFLDDDTITLSGDAIKTMTIRYAEGPRDAETLIAGPTGDLFIITKRESANYIYQTKFIAETKATLASVGKIDIKNITAGDMSFKGELLLRTYNQIYYWPNTPKGLAHALTNIEPEQIFTAPEPQGEAIAWDENGNIYSIPEKRFIFPQAINFYPRVSQ